MKGCIMTKYPTYVLFNRRWSFVLQMRTCERRYYFLLLGYFWKIRNILDYL